MSSVETGQGAGARSAAEAGAQSGAPNGHARARLGPAARSRHVLAALPPLVLAALPSLVLAALALIVLAGLVLRTTGVGFLLPQLTEPDGVVIDDQVKVLRRGDTTGETAQVQKHYPQLVARVAAAVPRVERAVVGPLTLDEHLERAREHRKSIRLVVAILSLLAVPATWWLARRWLPDSWALVAAALIATSVFNIWFAQQGRPHAAETSFALIAVLAALGLRRSGGIGSFALAGLAAGLALACLQNGAAVLPAIFVAVLLRARTRAEPLLRLLLGSVVCVALVGVVVWFFYPFLFDAPRKGDVGADGSMLRLSGHFVNLKMFNGRGFATVVQSLWEYDPIIAALAVVGSAVAVFDVVRRRRDPPAPRPERGVRDDLWIVLAYVVPYTLAIGLYQRTYQRFALPLMPYECVLAAYALCRVVSAAARFGTVGRRVAGGVVILLVCFQAFAAWRLVEVRSQPDTIEEAAGWIEAHASPAARVSVLTNIELPLMQTAEALEANARTTLDPTFLWYPYQHDLPPDAYTGQRWNVLSMQLSTEAQRAVARADPGAFVRGLDAEYVVLEVFTRERRRLPATIREAAAAQGELVARFSPDGEDAGEELPLLYQDDEYPYTTPWFARVLGARCVGPVVEIYKMR